MKMKPIATATLWSALSFLVIVLVAATVGVYGFDGYEKAWGRGPSLQVISWMACVVAVFVGVLAAVGFKLARVAVLRKPRYCGLLVGAVVAICTVSAAVVLPSNSELGGLPLLFTLCLLSLFGALFAARTVGQSGEHAA